MGQFIAISDTREQLPLEFDSPYIERVVTRKLDTGDYSIEGLEDILCIERKGSLAEFYRNVTQKRFEDELVRMQAYKYRYLVLEFSLSEVMAIPYSLGLSAKQREMCKLSPKYVMGRIAEIQVDYNVNVVFAETRDIVTDVVTNIMRRVYELQKQSN
jgi:ERCC4-type nuclease